MASLRFARKFQKNDKLVAADNKTKLVHKIGDGVVSSSEDEILKQLPGEANNNKLKYAFDSYPQIKFFKDIYAFDEAVVLNCNCRQIRMPKIRRNKPIWKRRRRKRFRIQKAKRTHRNR